MTVTANMLFESCITALVLTSTALARPNARRNTPRCGGGQNSTSVSITAETIELIMPSSVSCDDRGNECTNASVAAPYLADSMETYRVKSSYERAGVLALIAYESLQLQYKNNTNPENKANGQGTANQQSGAFNVEYANSFPELKSLDLTPGTVLAHVTLDEYNFATGAWYYTQQQTEACQGARAAAQQGDTTAWTWFSGVYLTDCVGVNITDPTQSDRITYWNWALDAFKITNDTTNST